MHLFYFLSLFFYWSIFALQCCLVAAIQVSESATCVHISPPSGASSHCFDFR